METNLNQPQQPQIAPVLMPTQKVVQKKHHWKFFLGWLVGFIFTLLILGGVVWWALTNLNLSKIENMTGADLSFLGKEIKEKNLSDLLGTITDVATNYDEYSFEELADDLGILDLEQIVTVAGVGETRTYSYKSIDLTSVIKGKIGEIGTNIQTVADSVSLAKLETAFNITLPDLIFVESIKDSTMSDLSSALNNLKTTYTLQDMSADFNLNLEGTILENLKTNTLGSLPAELDNMTIEEIVGTIDTNNKIMSAIKDIPIGSISTELPKLTLNEILGTESSESLILKSIGGTTVNNLGDAINNLTFAQLFPAPAGTDTRNALIKKLATASPAIKLNELDGKIKDIIDDLTVAEIFENTTIIENPSYTTGMAEYKRYEANQGIWAVIGTTVKVKDLPSRITDVMEDTTLGEFVWQGLIKSNTYTLEGHFETLCIPGTSKKLADCTLIEIVEFAVREAAAAA